jgi:nitrate reductase gamma subunit
MNTNTILFGLYPYLAAMVCDVGCWIRYDREQYSWKAGSSQMLRTKGMRLASNAFHVGILFVLAGHLVGLLMPESIYHYVISTPNKQLLAMVSGGLFGTLCFVGLTMLIVRRFTDERVRASSSFSDNLVLVLLYIQLILGLSTIYSSSHHMDGSVMVMLANWAQAIVLFQPMEAAASIAPVGLVYKLHVFLGVTLFLIFPFTRLVHIVSGLAAPVKYLLRNYQIVRQKRA